MKKKQPINQGIQLTIPFGEELVTYKKSERSQKNKSSKPVTNKVKTSAKKEPSIVPSSEDNVENYLNKNYRFRYNTVLERTEFKTSRQRKYRSLHKFDYNSIKRELNNAGYKISTSALRDLLESNFVHQIDPFECYLEKVCKRHKADGIDYIGQLVKTITFSKDPIQNKAMQEVFYPYFRKWMIAFVATMYKEGVYNENALIFIGDQGIGKTKWLLKLMPQELKTYIHQGLLRKNNNDTLTKISQNGLIIMDELDTLRDSEATSLKAILSQKQIQFRKSFARHDETYDRKASFVGTSNKDNLLIDETGNRRFLIYKVDRLDHNHKINMNKVFAQALRLFKRGERYWFNEQETASINKRNQQFTVTSNEEEILHKYISTPEEGLSEENIVKMNTSQLIEHINESEKKTGGKPIFNLKDREKIGKTLRKLGYHQITFRTDTHTHPIKGYQLYLKEVS
ncbi:VapE domain-containing protein [Sediminitomix flava]|uniref:Virulence-associated protein E n=1 Tax=Sediminitomix flava TaxID=379075 RepID=A0A315Z5E8_SEDFL|nr:VapE domain-containing protein [Sediminitomix flava]PWJ38642.1 virulence-associated protein E [Sediminitomix flava]